MLWNNPYALLVSARLIAGDLGKVLQATLHEIDQWDLQRKKKGEFWVSHKY